MSNSKHFVEEHERIIALAKETDPDKLLFTYKGVLYPSALCSQETFQALEAFEIRSEDMLMVSYPKCGTNWTLHIMYDMVYTISNKEPPPHLAMLEFGAPEKLEGFNMLPSPRVFTTHLHSDNIPKSAFENKAKTLVVLRNPKDTAVSFYNFYNNYPALPNFSSWDEFFQHFMSGEVIWGSYFDHAVAWNKRIDEENVMILMFEDMKADLGAVVTQIADFFGIRLTEEQIQFIADRGSFSTMKEKSTETHSSVGAIIFRKGEIGDWKNYFSEAQSQEMDAKFEEYLAGTKLGARMKYDVYCKT